MKKNSNIVYFCGPCQSRNNKGTNIALLLVFRRFERGVDAAGVTVGVDNTDKLLSHVVRDILDFFALELPFEIRHRGSGNPIHDLIIEHASRGAPLERGGLRDDRDPARAEPLLHVALEPTPSQPELAQRSGQLLDHDGHTGQSGQRRDLGPRLGGRARRGQRQAQRQPGRRCCTRDATDSQSELPPRASSQLSESYPGRSSAEPDGTVPEGVSKT